VALIGIITGPVYNLFKVDRQNTQPVGILLVHPISAHVYYGAALTPDEAAYLNQIFPLKKGWSYSCFDATVFFYRKLNFMPLQDNPFEALKIFTRLTLASPIITAKHFFCLSKFVWFPVQPERVPLETVYTENQKLDNPDWQQYGKVVNQNSKLPAVREFVVSVLKQYSRLDPRMIGWRPAIYLYFFTFAVLYYAYREKNWSIALLLVPVFIQCLIIAVSTQMQAVRYQYPVVLASMFFTVPLLYLASRHPKADQGLAKNETYCPGA
jgi:hypothetical protein